MNTTFHTICDEETMRATYPGQTLYTCADCQRRVCLFSDLDVLSEGCDTFCCPTCQQRRQDGKAHDLASCSCPACCAARTEEGAARIVSWNCYVQRKTVPILTA